MNEFLRINPCESYQTPRCINLNHVVMASKVGKTMKASVGGSSAGDYWGIDFKMSDGYSIVNWYNWETDRDTAWEYLILK